MWGKFVFSRFSEVLWKMWGKFQKVPDFAINFVKNEFFGTRKYFQNPELNDVPSYLFQKRENQKKTEPVVS